MARTEERDELVCFFATSPLQHFGQAPLSQEVVEEKCVCTAALTVKSCGLLSSGKHLFHRARDFPASW